MFFTLDAYGSTWPGSDGYVDDIGDEEEESEEVDDIENGAQALRDEAFATEFGQLVQTSGATNRSRLELSSIPDL
jgi:hypothetical protein